MRRTVLKMLGVGALLALVVTPMNALAQQQGQGRQGRGNFDPEQFRQQMAERMKTALQCSDDEWKVIGPLVENVQTLQRQAAGGRMRGLMFGAGPGGNRQGQGQGQGRGPGQAGPARGGFGGEPDPAAVALQETLDNANASPAQIKAKLDAVRAARQAREVELEKARQDLRKVLSVRQEAVLVMMGTLD